MLDIIEDAEQLISHVLRQLLFSLLENIHLLNERILPTEHCLADLFQQQPKYKMLMTIPGIGPLIAAAFLSEVNAEQFSSGRQLSAWSGLVPRQRSSGGKSSLSSMTKNGSRGLSLKCAEVVNTGVVIRKRDADDIMAWVIRPTNDAGYMAANRINLGLAQHGTSIYGTLNTNKSGLSIHKKGHCCKEINHPRLQPKFRSPSPNILVSSLAK
ncbi:transposase [Citrobacter braakii]|uniref:transposase n=1 Tax=Citrobacter braakii TaxID=57706 RepID=UPI003984A56F